MKVRLSLRQDAHHLLPSRGTSDKSGITTVGDTKEGLVPIRISAVSGSLRASSSNTALLKATRALAPEGAEIFLYDGLAALPHFNPDLDAGAAPPEVADFRSMAVLKKGETLRS